jgi:hypothetical protein
MSQTIDHECEEHRRIIRRLRMWLKVPEAQPVSASMDELMATVCMLRSRRDHLRDKYTTRRRFLWFSMPPPRLSPDLLFLVEALVEL